MTTAQKELYRRRQEEAVEVAGAVGLGPTSGGDTGGDRKGPWTCGEFQGREISCARASRMCPAVQTGGGLNELRCDRLLQGGVKGGSPAVEAGCGSVPSTSVVKTGGTSGTDAQDVLGVEGESSPGLGSKGDHASLAVRWVAVLLFRGGSL